MDKIRITGSASPKPLKGKIKISGAKNATLPLMAASLLTDQPIKFTNCPRLADVFTLEALLNHHGVESTFVKNTMTLTASTIKDHCAPYDLVRKMRASVLVLGPILAREGHAKVSLPGGCAIGTRPVDLHLMGLEKMGAIIEIDQGYIKAKAPQNGLQGAEIAFPTVSVGATENILMAATLAKGTTKLINAASEPEITDLANCLVKMGAKIEGIGTSTLIIEGVKKLSGAIHPIVADRIETGSYAIAAAMTGGELELVGTSLDLLPTFKETLEATGTMFTPTENGFIVKAPEGSIKSVDMKTAPFPGYPTDLQAQFMALMTLAEGSSNITETIFENRFMHVPELARMGADITLSGRTATVRGVNHLKGAEVMATDLRASVSLIMAGLCAEGETNVGRIYHLDRGYEDIENKLKACGGNIRRYRDGDTVKNDGSAKEYTG
ncbi:MAG TPA: UDP-N-acetylglucosamine 1-carboxyvinyltransferase [Holosporales bacterium]|nr:UDP-N-acetylglucosamine 1-carboxyvinyltransferase [Holosporales bacterium]